MSLRSRIVFAGLFTAGTAFAQQPPVPPPGGVPGVPGGVPGAPPPIVGLNEIPGGPGRAPDPDAVNQDGFTQPKMNGEQLADLYTRLTGRRVTVSNAAIAAEFRFVQEGPITYREASELLKIAALMEGFVFIPSGENHDKLVHSQVMPGPINKDIPVYTDAADLPPGDQVVTYVMPLKYIKPDEVVRVFTMIVGQFGQFGSIAPVANASAVVITENTSLIRRLIELQETIDVASTDVTTKFVRVQYADVTELAETLNQLINNQQQQQTSAGVQRVQQQAPQGVPQGAVPGVDTTGGGGAGEQIPLQIVPDARTNRIFAMGRPIDVVFVEGLVREFDSPTSDKNFLRRKLRFVPVAAFIDVAEQALIRASSGLAGGAGGASAAGGGGRSTGANFGGGGGGGSRGGMQSQQTGGRSGRSGFGSSQSGGGFGGAQSGLGGGGFGGGGVSSGSGGGLIADRQGSTAPVATVVGRTLLVADNITNSLVAQGPPASIEILNQLMDEIDVKPEQVMISCVFGQLALGDDFNFGVDYLRTVQVRGDNVVGGRGGSGRAPTLPLDPTAAFAPGNFGAGTGLGVYGQIGRYMNVYLEALQASSRFQVLSRPTVFMANNQVGRITSGTQIAVPTGSYSGNVSGGVTTNYEFRDVALTLEVVPLVNSDTEVTLEIYLVSQDLGPERDVGEFNIPDILNRELVTTVTVPNNETIVLGGLITTRDRKSKSGIPILSQIPLVGGLFGTETTAKDREELLIFIQPSIVKDRSDLYSAQADMEGRYKIDDEGRSFIDGPGVLPSNGAVNQPIQETKASRAADGGVSVPASEEKGGPRRATTRPKGFINRR